MGLIGKKEKVYKIRLRYWVKGMEVECPRCKTMVKDPYKCTKCSLILKPFVKMERE